MMRNTESKEIDEQAEQIFTNHLILREVLGNIPSAQLQGIRGVNKMTNYVATRQLNVLGSKVSRFYSGKEVTNFLDRMDMRLEDLLPFSDFGFMIGLIPLVDIQRFSLELEHRVRKLEIDFTVFTRTEAPSQRDPFWTGLLAPAGSQNLENKNGTQEKVIRLLSALFRNLEELQIIFQDEEEIGWEITFDEAELGRLPTCFPRLRHFTFRQINHFQDPIDDREWHRQIGLREQGFLPYIFSTAPKMELVTISCLPCTMSSEKWTVIAGELNQRPFPVSLDLCLCPGFNLPDEDFLRELIRIGYNNLRSLNIAIGSRSPERIIPLINTFINLQRKSLETLRLCTRIHGFVIPEADQDHQLVLPILPNLKRLYFYLNFNKMILKSEAAQLFPKLEEVTLCSENHPTMQPWFASNVRIILDHGIWPDTPEFDPLF